MRSRVRHEAKDAVAWKGLPSRPGQSPGAASSRQCRVSLDGISYVANRFLHRLWLENGWALITQLAADFIDLGSFFSWICGYPITQTTRIIQSANARRRGGSSGGRVGSRVLGIPITAEMGSFVAPRGSMPGGRSSSNDTRAADRLELCGVRVPEAAPAPPANAGGRIARAEAGRCGG